MAPINKKFRAIDALKLISSSTSSSPPSSPSVSSPPSVIVRNDCQRVETNGPYSSDSEQIDPSRVSLSQQVRRSDIGVISCDGVGGGSVNGTSQDLPIDATIGAKIDARKIIQKELASNDDSNENLTQNHSDDLDPNNSHALGFTGGQKIELFSPVSPSSSLQHHSQDQNFNRRPSHSQQQQYHHHQQHQQQRHNKHSEYHSHHLHELRQRHSESPNNPEAPLHQHLHSHLQLHPQHLNVHNHHQLKEHPHHYPHPHPPHLHHNHHHHHTGNVPNMNSHSLIPSNSSFETTSQHNPFNTFPFSPTSSAPSLPPSPASVITENIGYQKDPTSSDPSVSYDSNGIRTRADNSNSEPFPPEKSSKNFYSKRSNKSPLSPSPLSSDLHSHRHVSFRVDAPSPTPSKSSTNSDSHKSTSSSGKGQVDKSSEEYRLRRERNNIAVRKSRSKSKVKFIQTIDRMNQLEEENSKLHARIDEMSREVTVLRLLVAKYHREDPRRLEHLEHLLAIEMSQEISILDVGKNRSQNRNYEDSRSNIDPFFKER